MVTSQAAYLPPFWDPSLTLGMIAAYHAYNPRKRRGSRMMLNDCLQLAGDCHLPRFVEQVEHVGH